MSTQKTILISGISLPVHTPASDAVKEARRRLQAARMAAFDASFSLYRRSVDARKKNDIRFVYTVAVTGSFSDAALARKKDAFSLLAAETPQVQCGEQPLAHRPVIVGAGPAGLFCALLLAENGYAPLLIERGGSVAERQKAVSQFARTGRLDLNTNIQFGAGGAGTFSDGKLMTRVNSPLCGYVLDRFVEFGAPEDIRLLAKPHIGTDVLCEVVDAMIRRIEQLGGQVQYHTCLTDLIRKQDRMVGIKTTQGDIPTDALVLAVGHSARDVYEKLLDGGYAVEPKPISVGMRIEHLQEDIDRALYGDMAGDGLLGHAEYALSHNTKVRGVYTFCMCPGGEVVAAASEQGGVVVNGMSGRARDGKNANAAVVCSVFKEDYGATPQGAIAFQRKIERAAFAAGGGNYAAPICTVGDFLSGKTGAEPSRILPTYMGGTGVRLASPETYLPSFVTDAIRAALPAFDRSIGGFAAPDAVLTGAETRTSAPIRILRTPKGQALGCHGLYPCGEGAGYAGGITSAAIDGIRTALSLMETYSPMKD